MKTLLAIGILLLSYGYSSAQEFVVVNKCQAPQQYVVVNKCAAQAKPSTIQYATRSPVGHTHTCLNGHTWDHSITESHNCPVAGCGLSQYYQDSSPRMVTVSQAVQSSYSQHQTYSLPSFSGVSSGGCVGGNCPTPSTTTRRGIFR